MFLPHSLSRLREQSRRRDEGVAVRKVIVSEFVSLDGVFEAPDQWHFPYFNDEMGQEIGAAMDQADAMLMGRVLYEEWSAFWPQQDPEENPFAARINGIQKYVVSTTLEGPLGWNNSTLIVEDVAEEISGLKQQPGKDISISGSGSLVGSLLKEDGLIDELRLMVHPVVVGSGKRLFEEEGEQIALELMDSKTFSTGVVYLTYAPAGQEAEGRTE
jgi:dihydrofolate reductase